MAGVIGGGVGVIGRVSIGWRNLRRVSISWHIW